MYGIFGGAGRSCVIIRGILEEFGGVGFENFRCPPEAIVCAESPCADDPGILETGDGAVRGIPLVRV